MDLKTRTEEVKTAENPIKALPLTFPPLGRLFGLSLPLQALGELGGFDPHSLGSSLNVDTEASRLRDLLICL